MIISPPFLPAVPASADTLDAMMDKVDSFATRHGIYPIAFDRRWHCGQHLDPREQSLPVRAIADGEVVAYRVCQNAICDGKKNDDGSPKLNSDTGFVLLRHTTETGDGRTLTFYSLSMHLLNLNDLTALMGNLPAVGSAPHVLPAWLRTPTTPAGSAVGGESRKVYRKDILGYPGKCHDQFQLHFEIFMTQPGFEAYFGQTQLGRTQSVTSTTTDCWGSTYYVIPPQQAFLALPPGTDAHHRLNGIPFRELDAGQNAGTLYVEVYFHRGTKYTRVWQDTGDGQLKPLSGSSSHLESEAGYEYDLYKRATALYPACPSDGYELLRFGRILSTPATLGASAISTPPAFVPGLPGHHRPLSHNPCATWVQVTFAEGRQGYIDISQDAVLKLSDADFPFFKGWKKISEGQSPFNADRLCDVDSLRKIVADTRASETSTERGQPDAVWSRDQELSRYLNDPDHEDLREQLRGFICEAPTEWDASKLEPRYRQLLAPGEFYDGRVEAYNKFIAFAAQFCFWDKTGLPDSKLWFFHPLQFIRHFRRCGWLSLNEFKQIYSNARYGRQQQPTPDQLRTTYLIPLNYAIRKYGMTDPARLAHFLGQGAAESA
ncbi:peptidase M23 [Paraburkholderia bonniea]|uniref:peptidase M23 n=1 Tax=Paraburkholderia bonniea TaxID=2152891 RepID=UPI002573970B|nr:peptidase M23 [Paraburkholderia bonniea]WJF88892.1 peptidase M23 [Paraburkholderia bonniea]WJF92208.1 peptidase M23 [Paraburkholderia bonniea]